MIRESKAEDISAILTLWMESTIHAHPFIEERYWHESESVVRDVYLPAAQTWVWEEEGELKGFVSVIDDRFLGALFVAPAAIRSGIGKALSKTSGFLAGIGEIRKRDIPANWDAAIDSRYIREAAVAAQ